MVQAHKRPPPERDCEYADQLVCPYCGNVDRDCWELTAEDDDTWCGSCGRQFRYSRHISITYSSHPIIGPHELSGPYLCADQEQS